MKCKIVIASTNQGKIQEITEIMGSLEGIRLDIVSLSDYLAEESEEPYDSFMDNAIHKAKQYAKWTKEATLSEDSGLCIAALNGFPGVNSRGFIEENGGIQNAFAKLEQRLLGATSYNAYFCTASALYFPKNDFLITHEAKIDGVISFPPRGAQGFGYDPLFIPEGYQQTFAELGSAIKTQISHRTKAIQGIARKLRSWLEMGGAI